MLLLLLIYLLVILLVLGDMELCWICCSCDGWIWCDVVEVFLFEECEIYWVV